MITSNIKKSEKKLELFFGIKTPKYRFVYLKSREEIDRLKGYKTENWVCGFTIGKTIYILHPEVIEKTSTCKVAEISSLFKHELAHIFYVEIARGEDRPLWLNEGLALHLGEQDMQRVDRIPLQKIEHYFDSADEELYYYSFSLVKYLINVYGKNKIIQLLKSIEPSITKKSFPKVVQRIYGKPLNRIIADYTKK